VSFFRWLCGFSGASQPFCEHETETFRETVRGLVRWTDRFRIPIVNLKVIMTKRFSALLIAVTLTCCAFETADAGGGPENVIVVVNADSWASRWIANEYIRLRSIPAGNVVYLRGLPDLGTTKVDMFRERILKPVLAAVEKRGLTRQIDCITYSSDLPYAVDVRSDLGSRKVFRVLTPTASINGLTYLYEPVLAKDVNYLRLDSNRYMRRRLSGRKRETITSDEMIQYGEATRFIRRKKWADAVPILRKLANKHPDRDGLHYNLACCLARTGKADDAIAALRKAVGAGWSDSAHAGKDADLAPLRKHKEFAALLKAMDGKRKETFDVQPTLAFHNSDRWNERGEKVTDGGRRYLLSTMLAFTGGRGTSVAESVASLRRAASADFTQPSGTIYFLVNGDIRSRTREGAFLSAVAQLKRLGVKAEILKGVLPRGKNDVMGAMIGTASFNWPSSKSTISPGAICEHLTSFGGVMRERAGQTPLTEFLRHGAAASSGTVTEPYAIQAKFPFAFLHVHYARGCSLAEAFYQSVAGPYQLLIVGDPLCQPWGKRSMLAVTGLKAGATVSGEIKISATAKDANGAELKTGRLELFIDGRRVTSVGLKEHMTVDTRALSDGYHEARIVAVRGDAVATQSRVLLPFTVNNQGRRATLTASATGNVPWDKPIRLRMVAKNAKSIAVIHNGRLLKRIDGDAGDVTLSTLEVGPGPVRIFAIAMIDGQSVSSPPIEVAVVPPTAMKPLAKPQKTRREGLLLTIGEGKSTVIESTRDRQWLAKSGIKPGQTFKLSGEFSAERDGVYQFQLRGNCGVEVTIDGRKLHPPDSPPSAWEFLPVHLQRGTHRTQLRGTAAKTPQLEIRFGDRGAQSLDGKRFHN
jgi:Tetratricopeptide repeat